MTSGRVDRLLISPRFPSYAVRGGCFHCHALPLHEYLLADFSHSLRPSLQLAISVTDAMAFAASFRAHSGALSLIFHVGDVRFVCLPPHAGFPTG